MRLGYKDWVMVGYLTQQFIAVVAEDDWSLLVDAWLYEFPEGR